MKIIHILADWQRQGFVVRRVLLSPTFLLVMAIILVTHKFAHAKSDCTDQACKDLLCKADFAPHIENSNFVALSRMFKQRPIDDYCSLEVLDGLRLESTKQLASRAQQALVQEGPGIAQDWLTGKKEATFRLASSWQINVIRGEIEASRKNWLASANQFETSYDLYLTEQERKGGIRISSDVLARRLYLRAMDARHLSGTMVGSISRSGKPGSTLGTRGYVTQTVPMPIAFETDSSEIKVQGHENIELIVAMIEAEGIQQLDVVGHTDWYGSTRHNAGLSLRRANAVAQAIKQKLQRPLKITTIGRGEDCPRIVSQLDQYTKDEVAAMYRRVSLSWPRDINSDLDDCDPNGIIDR